MTREVSTDPQPTPTPSRRGGRVYRILRGLVTALFAGILALGLSESIASGASSTDVAMVTVVGGLLVALVWWAFPLLAVVAAIFLGES